MLASNWTRDAGGDYVDWTEFPYYKNGVLVLLLEGEDPARLSAEIFTQRIREYCLLARRELRAGPGA